MIKRHLFVSLAIAFSLKALILPDVASVTLSIVWAAAHFLVHFFGTDTAKARLETRISEFEASCSARIESIASDLKEVKTKQEQHGVAQALRPTRF